MKPVWLSDPQAVARFKQEAITARKLRHPHIIDIYDVGEVEGQVYLALLLVEGETLAEKLKREGPLKWDDVLKITSIIGDALDYAHGQGIIHRDIKPENILLGADQRAYLGDFGLILAVEGSSRLSTSGSMVGTGHYMAPEVWDGKKATPATDVYALSCVIYEVLTGEVLFEGSSMMAVLKKHVEGPKFPDTWPASVPEGVTNVLNRGLSENPTERISSAGELAAELSALATSDVSTAKQKAKPPSEPTQSQPTVAEEMVEPSGKGRRNRMLIGVGAIIFALIACAVYGVYSFFGSIPSTPVVQNTTTPTATATSTPRIVEDDEVDSKVTVVATATDPTTVVLPTPTREVLPTSTPAKLPTAKLSEEGCNDPLGCVIISPGDPIRLASALVIAGPNETLGIDSQTGVEVAILQRGAVAGHPVELQPEDGGCLAEGGQTAATKIASDETIVAVIGHNCSSSCTPAAPIYNDAGLTMISPSCTAPALTGEGTHVDSFLRTVHNDNVQGRVMAEYVYNELGLRTAATIHDGSPYAEQLQQVFADVFSELGGTITAQEAVNVGDTDMRPVLTSIAVDEPEFLYYPIFIAEGGFITTQAKEVAGLENTTLAGADGMISPDFIAAAGEAAEGMYISGPNLTFTGPLYDRFLTDYIEILGQEPVSAFHAHAYDATNMVFNAIAAVAKTDGAGNTIIGRQALRNALYGTANFEGITGNLNCNELGDCADPQIVVYQIQGGEYVPIFQGGEMFQ